MTTGSGATLIMPDVCNDIELAYRGKNGLDGHVAEIYAYRLVPHLRDRPVGAKNFTQQDAIDAAGNLLKLCRAFRVIHPDAVFSIETHTPRLFEEIDIDVGDAANPIQPFVHRMHLKVFPKPVDDPKVCVLLSWKFGTGVKRHFRVIVDGTYVTVEDRREDRLGTVYWHPYDSARGLDEDKIVGAALGAIVRCETIERSYANGVITIEIPSSFVEEE